MPNRVDIIKNQKNWNSLFAEAVDDTLKQIFKEDGAKVIYEFLENHSRLRLEEVADKPEVFSATLERLMVSAAQKTSGLSATSSNLKREWFSKNS